MTPADAPDGSGELPAAELAAGLADVRRRRWALWGLIWIYLPVIVVSLRVTGSDRATSVVFGIWVLLVGIASIRAAFARCPRCGNYFHMQAFVPLYLRRCVHCDLHLCADRKQRRPCRARGGE